MYSVYDLLPKGKVVEVNKSTGLRIGHILAQQSMVVAGATPHIHVQGDSKFLYNGFIGFQKVTGEVTVVETAAGVTAPQPYLHFTAEKQGGYSNFLSHYMTPYHDSDTDEVYPRMIALYPGDVFTTDNFHGTAADGTVTIDPATGQVDFDITIGAAGSGELVFRAEVTTLPDAITEAVKLEYIGRN